MKMTQWVHRGVRLALVLGLAVWSPITHHPSPITDTAWAAIPLMINYQGKLSDTSGKAVTGTLTFTFRLYDAVTSGTKQWEEQQTITLSSSDNGVFNAVLGSVTALSSVNFNSPLWLSIQVGDDTEMTPRQRLTAVGYAINADTLDSLDSTKFMRADVNTSTSGKLTITATVSATSPALVISSETTPSYSTSTATQMVLSQASSGTNNFLDAQVGGTSKFKVDASGNVTVAGNLAVSGTTSGSTSTTGTTNASWNVGSGTDATTTDVSLLFGQASGQESLVFDGDSTGDFLLSDDLRLLGQSGLRFADSDSSNYVAFKAPATVSSNVTWTLPSADGSASQLLSTDGSGTLSWVTASSLSGLGDITSVTAGTGLTGGGTSGDVTLTLSTPISVANGGTGATTAAAARTALSAAASGANSDITSLSGLTTALPVSEGGTASTTASAARSALSAAASGANSDITSLSGLTTALSATQGGTGQSTYTTGDTLYSDASNSLAKLSGNTSTTKKFLTQTGTGSASAAPAWGTIAASDVSGGTLTGDVLLDTTGSPTSGMTDAQVNRAVATGALAIANDPSAAATDGVIKLGKATGGNSGWAYLQFDSSARSGKGQFVFSKSQKIIGDSPPTIEFYDGTTSKTLTYDSTSATPFTFNDKVSVVDLNISGSSPAGITFGSGTNTQTFSFDPNAGGSFAFSGGTFAQQFRNLVRNASFEAFSSIETFKASTASCPSGGCGGSGSNFYGGWQNFGPDEWIWAAGQVFQRSPFLLQGTAVGATNLQQDFYEGKSAVTLKDSNTAASNTYNDVSTTYAESDAHIKQTLKGLKPSAFYSVGIYMLTFNPSNSAGGYAANASTEAIVDITGEDVGTAGVTSTTLTANLAASATRIDVNATPSQMATFPPSGVLIIDSERISYAGKDDANHLFTVCIRGFEESDSVAGTGRALPHAASSAVVKVAPFKHLTTLGSSTATKYTLYKSQFATDNAASDVTIHLFCNAAAAGDECRFDAAQVVEGRSVPQFQPSAIVDTGDQTVYGSLRMGRTSDDRGGILSVDKSVRTRAIEFFDKDPGMSGSVGGFGGIGQPVYITAGATPAITPTTSGTYYSTYPRDFRITGLSSTTFKVEARDCPTSPCISDYISIGANGLTIGTNPSTGANDGSYNSVAANIPGSAGIMLKFSGSSGLTASDQWTFHAEGMNMGSQYNSYSGTASYQAGNTRIYAARDANGVEQLYFQDSTGAPVSLQSIRGAGVGGTASIDSPQFISAGGTMSMNTSGTYSGGSNLTYWVQITDKNGTNNRVRIQWSTNGGGCWTGDGLTSGTCATTGFGDPPIEVSSAASIALNNGVTVSFYSPSGAFNDGAVGDRWTFGTHTASSTSVVASVAATANKGIAIDGTTANPSVGLIDCSTNGYILKWNNSVWSCQPDSTGGGGVTSVGLSLPSELSVSGSPVTGSGTLTGAWATQTANKVFASPSSGAAAAPAFRALVAADIPTLDWNKIDTATNKVALGTQVSGTLAAGNFPALTGDVTTSAGSLATTIANSAITDAKVSATAAIAGTKVSPSFGAQALANTGLSLTTDADGTVGAASLATTVAKNDALAKTFSAVQIKPTLNAGASNANTIFNVLNLDTTNTATTGLTTNLINAAYGGVAKFTVDATGTITTASIGTAALKANSVDGTKIAMGSDASGDTLYYNGTDYVRLAKGSDGQVLKLASGLPSWAADSTGGSPSFDTVATGTNTTATMTVGTGGSLTYSGNGTVNANQFKGNSTVADADVVDVLTLTNIKQTSGTTSGHTVPAVADDTFTLNAATQTLTNKTLTSPKIGTNILDSNGNALMTLTATGSAVNAITLANAATGGKPTITASGTDTDISINFVPKGAGTVQVNGTAVLTSESDPQVGTLTNAKWCTSDGSAVNCATNAPVTAESDPIVAAITGLVKSNGTTISAAAAGTDYVAPNAAITGATKTKITYDAKGLVTSGADATTADIAASTNKNYVTDAQLTVIGNTSGSNTGDQTITLTGDVTGTGTGSFATTIANNAVTSAKISDGTIAAADLASASVTKVKIAELAPSAQSTADKTVAIAAGKVYVSGNTLINFVATNANFASGGNCAYTAVASGKYVKALINLNSSGVPACTFGTEQADTTSAQNEALTYPTDKLPIEEIILKTSGTGAGAIANIGASNDTTNSYLYADVRPMLNLGSSSYTAGNGLSLTGSVFAVKLDASPGLALDATNGLSLLRSCGTNQLLKWNGSAWGCADDSGVGAEADGIVGNEVTDAANTTLTRSGAGTGNDPYKLAVNLGNANTWTAAQTIVPGSDVAPLLLKRGTDTSPTANLLTMKNNAADTTLFAIDKDGAIATGTLAWGSVTGKPANLDTDSTNDVVTSGSYSDPAWITSLAGSKISGNISGNAANVTGVVLDANVADDITASNYLPLAGGTMTGNIVMPNNGTIGQAAGPLLNFDDTNNYLEITGANVGIGTTTPAYNLDVNGIAKSNNITTKLGANNPSAYLGYRHVSNPDIGLLTLYNGLTSVVNLDVASTSWINNDGNFGFGTTGPNAKLDVNGTSRLGDSTTNYTAISATGAMTFAGTAQPKRTIVLTAAGAIPPSGGPSQQQVNGTNFNYFVLSYPDGSTKDAYWQFVVPDSYTGATVNVTLYWMSSATSGSCRWELATDGKPVDAATAFDTALTAATPVDTATNGTANALTTTAVSSVTSGWAAGEVAVVRVSRLGGHANDTLATQAKLVMVKIEWTASAESD